MVDFKNPNTYFLRKKIRMLERGGSLEADSSMECSLQMFTRRALGTARAGQGKGERPCQRCRSLGTWGSHALQGGSEVLLPHPATIRYRVDVGIPGGQQRVDNRGHLSPAPLAAGAASGR